MPWDEPSANAKDTRLMDWLWMLAIVLLVGGITVAIVKGMTTRFLAIQEQAQQAEKAADAAQAERDRALKEVEELKAQIANAPPPPICPPPPPRHRREAKRVTPVFPPEFH